MAAVSRPANSKNPFDYASASARFVFFTGVFCVFAPFSLIYDLISPKGLSWMSLAGWTLYSGLTAAGWAYGVTRNPRFLWIHVPLSFVVATYFSDTWYYRPNAQAALAAEAGIAIAMIVIGYVCIAIFITGEGTAMIRLRTEIRLAKEIHDYLVPAIQHDSKHLELYGISHPATEVGGDLMDVHHGAGKTGLYVADVTGHGVPAGVSMGMVKSAIRMKLRSNPPLGELLGDLNDVISETQRPGTLATFAALEIHEDGNAAYALAGHLPILHFRAATRTLEKLPNKHLPFGVFAGGQFSHSQIAAQPGDLFVILTDGFTEVFNSDGEEFGEARLEKIVGDHGDRPLVEIYDKVVAAARAFGPQLDDQTLLLARVR